jgi:hypothetical protein
MDAKLAARAIILDNRINRLRVMIIALTSTIGGARGVAEEDAMTTRLRQAEEEVRAAQNELSEIVAASKTGVGRNPQGANRTKLREMPKLARTGGSV